jgi:hypothetical protein
MWTMSDLLHCCQDTLLAYLVASLAIESASTISAYEGIVAIHRSAWKVNFSEEVVVLSGLPEKV